MTETRTATDGADLGVDLTVILPAYNEQGVIASVIQETRAALGPWEGRWEIVVVDDASTDKTAELAEATGVRVIRRLQNGGSGAARKTGIRHARGTTIAMFDVDGTYRPADLISLLAFCPPYDLVNGARIHEHGTYKPLRMTVKWLVRKLAEWISAKRIPDLNTGMKVFNRKVMCQYLWTIPDGFSCVSSMTLAMLCNGHAVHYVPIEYRPRIGRSKFKPIQDTARYISTVIRVMMYFRPLRVFLPLSAGLGIVGLGKTLFDVIANPAGMVDSDVLLFTAAITILAIGLLADVVVAQRRGGNCSPLLP